MKTIELLTHLRSLDVTVRVDGDQLDVDAPEGVLTPDLLEGLASHKAEIIIFLRDAQLPIDAPPIERASRVGNLPLSHAQQRLWFLDQLESGSAYVMPSATLLRGEIDVPALEASLNELVRRHESLRTVFESRTGIPRQVVRPPSSVRLPVVDLRDLAEDARLREARKQAADNASEAFDLAKGPLFRAKLLRLASREHVLLVAFHHIVFDAWSGGVFVREFAALYGAFCAGAPSPLQEPELQYVDFASWQRQRLDSGGRETHLAYWKERLGGELPVLKLPADRPRRGASATSGASHSVRLSAKQLSELRTFSHREGVTLSMVLLAAFKVLLHRVSGQNDIILGTPVSGRDRVETEKMIGFFINTVVLRSNVTPEITFRTLLQNVRNTALGAYAHQDMPFEELVGLLDPHRDLNRTPIFQIFFNHLNSGGFESFELPGLSAQPFGESRAKSKFDLTLYVHEQAAGLDLRLVYNADLFDEERMHEFIEQYVLLLDRLPRDSERPIGSQSLVTAAARKVLPDPTVGIPSTGKFPDGTLVCADLGRFGANVAIAGASTWTYARLDASATRLASLLVRHGVRRGDVVAVYAKRDPLLICALLAILRAGGAFSIFDPAYPDSRLADSWRAANPVAMIRLAGTGSPGSRLAAGVAASKLKIDLEFSEKLFDDAALPREPDDLPAIGSADLAYIAFTSGTTGAVKAVEGRHGPVAHFLNWQRDTFGLGPEDRFTMLSGLSHDPLLRDVFAPLWAGATLEIPSPQLFSDPAKLVDWMRAARVTVMHLTPAMAQLLCAAAASAFEDLRLVFSGGDRLRGAVVTSLQRAAPHATVVNFYGATETPQAMSYHVIASAAGEHREYMPLGRGIDGVQLLVVNADGSLAGVGEIGEILVRTAHLSNGYRGTAAVTRERFTQNPLSQIEDDRVYRTGDSGRYLSDGSVEFAGRRDDQVKVRGFRVELGEIEAVLRRHPAVGAAAVTLCEQEVGEPYLVGYVAVSEASDALLGELRALVTSSLPDYAVPATFIVRNQLPLTPNGKVDRKALPDPESIEQSPALRTRRLLTPLENQLLVIWEQVLGRDGLEVTDNFFDLGGTSLTAVRLFSQLRKIFGKDLPLATLFQAPTVEKLAALMHNEGRSTKWKSLVAIQPGGENAPLFMVPGVGGNVLEFARLANLLGADQPFYGAQSRGLDGKEPPLRVVQQMAREYLKEIRELQPHGPYQLGGACMGGVVAFEMAQQLQADGERVALLALVDTPLTRSLNRKRYRLLSFLHPIVFVVQGVSRHLGNLRGKSAAEWWGGIRTVVAIVRQMILQRDVYRGDRNVLYQDVVTAANYEALASYVPREYQGRLHLFVASERPVNPAHYSRLDWAKFAAGGFSVFRINAKDSGELLRSPYVMELADKISEALNAGATARESPDARDDGTSAVGG